MIKKRFFVWVFFEGVYFVYLDCYYLLVVCCWIVYFVVSWGDVFVMFFINYKDFVIVDKCKCIGLRLVYGFDI